MIYILEGPDCAGKSTLAIAMSKRLGMPIVHFGAPKNKLELKNMFGMYVSFLIAHNNVIMDRSWYSEIVYGPLLRGHRQITPKQQSILEDMVICRGGQITYCYDEVSVLIQRMEERTDDLIDTNQLEAILDGYNKVLKTIDKGLPVVHYKVPTIES